MRLSSGEFWPPSTILTRPNPTSIANGSTLSKPSRFSRVVLAALGGGPLTSGRVRRRQPPAPNPTPSSRNGMPGMPGRHASTIKTPLASSNGCGLPKICLRKSALNRASEPERVMMRPPETEIISAGTTVTRPSPMVSTV